MTEQAPAKVNLTLRIVGRRPDGYHELQSLVAFASDVFDEVAVSESTRDGMAFKGAFKDRLSDLPPQDSTLAKVLTAWRRRRSPSPQLSIAVTKAIPAAAGLGGGSADAAALLRLLSKSVPDDECSHDQLSSMALEIGADVPACLRSKALWMSGLGERIDPVAELPKCYAVLVNAKANPLANKTAAVFQAMSAPPFTDELPASAPPPQFRRTEDLIAFAAGAANDLEPAAMQLMPEIAEVRAALAAEPGCTLARMSGAGPTVFGLFESRSDADAACHAIARGNPSWWTAVTVLV